MSEKASGNPEMQADAIRDEMSAALRRIAEPRPVGDTVSQAIYRSARRLGISPGRAKRLWYREASVQAHEADLIRERARKQRAREMQRLREQLSAIEAQQRMNTDALIEDARQLLGPLFDRLVAHGLVTLDGVEIPKDGEA